MVIVSNSTPHVILTMESVKDSLLNEDDRNKEKGESSFELIVHEKQKRQEKQKMHGRSQSRNYNTPIPAVLLTTRQPAETCGYRVPRYHTHMSHISRPILAYSVHNIQKYMIDYNHSLFTVPSIPKRCACFGSARIEYKTKTKQNKAVFGSHPI